ncbi:MAG: energy transducer TonB [Acidobacteriaceae bacterium]|nr:energy transducer TonB [Acidobacteriaceae bacterium]
MSRIITQSIFHTQTARRSWQSYATSSAVHIGMITALFLITFPAVKDITKPKENVTLIAPALPKYKPKILPKPVVHPKVVFKVQPIILPKPRPVIPPPVIRVPQPPKQLLAKAPEIKAEVPVLQHLPETKIEAPAPPKPEVRTGVFNSSELAKGQKTPNEVKVGGFGDPHGVHPSTDPHQGKLMMASLGSFDLPNGPGQGGGGGHAQNGGVRAAGFGSAGDPNGVPGGTGVHGGVRTGGFGDETTGGTSGQAGRARQAEPATTPVEILFKPKPAYSQEARNLRLEGQVSLEVVFSANGSVRVLRVVRGLGHGLDEAAEQAATQVRFKPATRGGVPVDTNATINITFELT